VEGEWDWAAYDRHQRTANRSHNALGSVTLTLPDDTTAVQSHQIEGHVGEVRNGAIRLQAPGFSSMPLPGAKGIALYPGGQRANAVIVATEDTRYRMKGLKPGEGNFYGVDGADAKGEGGTAWSALKALSGQIAKLWGKTITIGDGNTITINVSGQTINMTVTHGDVVVNGISMVHHTHPDPQGGFTGQPV
jgi:phage baseplate assembly protein V